MFKEPKETMSEELKVGIRMISHWMESHNKVIETILKRKQLEILELKNIITEISNLLEGPSSIFELADGESVNLKLSQ